MKTRVLTLFNKESNLMVYVMTDLVNVRENQRSNKELTIDTLATLGVLHTWQINVREN